MTTRVFLLNGWSRLPNCMYWPSLGERLKAEGATVIPNTLVCEDGDINKHISHLSTLVGQPDSRTFFIGQSVGNQVIARYLASYPKLNKLVAGSQSVGGSRST